MVDPPVRPLVVAAGATVAAFGALTAVQIASPPQTDPFSRPSDYVIEALFLAGLLAVTTAVVMLHRWHRDRSRWNWFGLVATVVSGGGTALVAIAVAATLLSGRMVLGEVFLIGALAWLVGGVLLAVAAYRAGLLPRPVAVLFGVAMPLSGVIGEPAGPVTVAVLWAVVAFTVRRRADGQPRHDVNRIRSRGPARSPRPGSPPGAC